MGLLYDSLFFIIFFILKVILYKKEEKRRISYFEFLENNCTNIVYFKV